MQKSKKNNWARSQPSLSQERTALSKEQVSQLEVQATTEYRGRFAPSPSGPLHFGSIIAAVASYFRAKSEHGKWLLRIEDADLPRTEAGATEKILECLTTHGLIWDEDIYQQSEHFSEYQSHLDRLVEEQLAYPCQCSRKLIKTMPSGYDGRCRNTTSTLSTPFAWRIVNTNNQLSFYDHIYGEVKLSTRDACEDFILKRRDGYFSYQFAVVLDDIKQGITEIVRGYDIHDSTLKQSFLHQLLGCQPPKTAHIPLAMANDAQKLSKQNQATAVDNAKPAQNLYNALRFLGQQPPSSLARASVDSVIEWGSTHWKMDSVPTKHQKV